MDKNENMMSNSKYKVKINDNSNKHINRTMHNLVNDWSNYY